MGLAALPKKRRRRGKIIPAPDQKEFKATQGMPWVFKNDTGMSLKPMSEEEFVTKLFVGDSVNHPSHYNSGKIEVIEAIEDWKLGYHLGNTVKYVARAGKKNPDKEVEDLEKAAWYLNRRILKLKADKSGTPIAKPNDTSINR